MGSGRKRRRGDGELRRVAEIVMVLAAAGEARGGRAPTAAERALVAEARGRLAAAVAASGDVRPKELFPREAVRALVEDLGLSRARDPAAMGYRPRRASIAERILHTKRKMEEVKAAPVHTIANMTFQPGVSKPSAGPPRNLSTGTTSPTTMPAGASSAKSANITSLSPIGSATQSRAPVGEATKSTNLTTIRSSQSTVQISSPRISLDKKAHPIQPVSGNTIKGHQAPLGASFVQQKPFFYKHNAISKNVQRILHRPSYHGGWTLPSSEYMHARLDCQICKVSSTDVEGLLVCDACERGVHLNCLQRHGNDVMPNAEWYCPTCVSFSRGKSLPPKYGKVTRTIVAPKSSLTSAVTSQRASENPTTKENSEKETGNGTSIKQNYGEAGRTVCNSDMLALDTISSKPQSLSASGPEKENVKSIETSSKQKEEHDPPCSGVVTGTAKTSNEIGSTGAPAYSDAGNLSERSHTKSETKGDSDQHLAGKAADNGVGNPQGEEITEDNIKFENAHQVISNEDLVMGGTNDEAVDRSTDLSDVDWVGDALEVVDQKTYYNACSIDGVTYNLQDHILISSEDDRSTPSKLQSLWEEHDSRSKMAMVNPYLFASDIQESITKSCTAEEDEVYASDNQRVVPVSAICGPCDVLHVDKFREETKRRSWMHPIFFARWKYDESTGSLDSVDS